MMPERVIGILGGMGPESTADLYVRIIHAVPAKRDQDHPRVIIYSNSKIPDRTAAILGKGQSPVLELIMAGKRLEEAGADFIIIPCNTAHYFIQELRNKLRIPIINMIELSANRIHEKYGELKTAGLLATDGTIRSDLYTNAFRDKGITITTPNPANQAEVMKAIYSHIKAGDLPKGKKILHSIAEKLISQGAEAIICGCTEVSLVLKDGDLPVPIFDPLQALAEEAVNLALYKG